MTCDLHIWRKLYIYTWSYAYMRVFQKVKDRITRYSLWCGKNFEICVVFFPTGYTIWKLFEKILKSAWFFFFSPHVNFLETRSSLCCEKKWDQQNFLFYLVHLLEIFRRTLVYREQRRWQLQRTRPKNLTPKRQRRTPKQASCLRLEYKVCWEFDSKRYHSFCAEWVMVTGRPYSHHMDTFLHNSSWAFALTRDSLNIKLHETLLTNVQFIVYVLWTQGNGFNCLMLMRAQ